MEEKILQSFRKFHASQLGDSGNPVALNQRWRDFNRSYVATFTRAIPHLRCPLVPLICFIRHAYERIFEIARDGAGSDFDSMAI